MRNMLFMLAVAMAVAFVAPGFIDDVDDGLVDVDDTQVMLVDSELDDFETTYFDDDFEDAMPLMAGDHVALIRGARLSEPIVRWPGDTANSSSGSMGFSLCLDCVDAIDKDNNVGVLSGA